MVRQYIKNIGREVAVTLPDGQRITGTLISANDEAFEVLEKIKVKKQITEVNHRFTYTEIKRTKENFQILTQNSTAMGEMEHINLVETFSEFKEFKNIERETLMRILEDVFRHMLIKKYGTDENIDIIVNVDKGDLEIWRNRTIVDDEAVEDENLQIAYSDAIKIEPDFEVGEEVVEPIRMLDFGRREILAIRQNLISKVQEYEKDNIYRKYKDKIGEVITGEVYQVWKNEILVLDDEYLELTLPRAEQIPGDFYRKGDSIKAGLHVWR
jgi:small nuclear ribonucleoprotein (snRNP)-like protein